MRRSDDVGASAWVRAHAFLVLFFKKEPLLFLSVFLLGLSHLAALPPFEGFDETAHWSSIQQIADTGRTPRYGQDRLSAAIDAYPGPQAAATGQPYRDWFAAHDRPLAGEALGYRPGAALNWQAQHPPLFYLLMAPLYRLVAHAGWIVQFFVLRLVCWSLAFAGFVWGAIGTRRVLAQRGIADRRLFLPALWPLIFPQFFPEFARLTNDTLCLLLMAAVWCLVLLLLESPRRGLALALGAVLGAGLLTKAFFLPVTAGVGALLAWQAWQGRDKQRALSLGLTLLVAIGLGAPFYLAKLAATGDLIGGNDFILLRPAGGLLAGLRAHFTWAQYALGLTRILAGFAWAGTWSFAHPPRLAVAPLCLLALLAAGAYVGQLRRRDAVALAPLMIVGPVIAGLCWHLLRMVAFTGLGAGTPGWYLHIFAGPLGLALVLGWRWPGALTALAAYGLLFGAAMVPWQLAFFSGCLARPGAGAATLTGATCLVSPRHLALISLPWLSLTAFLAACLCLAVAASGRPATMRPAINESAPAASTG
jgi:hypothetical protein